MGALKRFCFLALLAAFLFSSTSALAFDHSHKAWTKLLKKHVEIKKFKTSMNYKTMKAKSSRDLDAYLKSLSKVSKKEYKTWNKDRRLAFLINSYNAFTVKLIVKNYPVKSIKDIGGALSSPWKEKFFDLLGKKTDLDEIEHSIIRKEFDEPRIHFALVCAARSCPPLRDEAYRASELEHQLENNAVMFLLDKDKNYYDLKHKSLEISKIFSWYEDDFKKYGGVAKFLASRITTYPKEQKYIFSGKVGIDYKKYNWALNEPKTAKK